MNCCESRDLIPLYRLPTVDTGPERGTHNPVDSRFQRPLRNLDACHFKPSEESKSHSDGMLRPPYPEPSASLGVT